MAKDELDLLRDRATPRPDEAARQRALAAAMTAFEENLSAPSQGTASGRRLSTRANVLWSRIMDRRLVAAPAIAGLMVVPLAGVTAYLLAGEGSLRQVRDEPSQPAPQSAAVEIAPVRAAPEAKVAAPAPTGDATILNAPPGAPAAAIPGASMPPRGGDRPGTVKMLVAPRPAGRAARDERHAAMPAPPASDPARQEAENRDRFETFDANPVRSALESPVSTFSVDVDTASYAFVRSSLKNGVLPEAETVRVEEMVNYFPYDWKGPETAAVPFNTTVSIMPTPWNDHTRLMHVAIKGYDVQPAARPRANLVLLVDTSGSMDQPDKLPLLKNALRMLVERLAPEDTVSIVAYAGNAGTVLEPTRAADRMTILAALERLEAGGSTAGEAGIREAYRLAAQSFVEGGVNRVMLATDGDFNVGQTSDDDLERLVKEKRASGVFLSVFGFGRGNYNDRMMQTIAQNGNGTAAYIDTLAEAEKVLVQESSATLFPIAKDVKIQVEFNPQQISEYRLIGYETRALKREDFNNDRVDAGDIGSGHSVTAIYEITPKDSPAQMIDALRYGTASTANGEASKTSEYAYVKLRYKLPDQDMSRLIERPVTAADAVASFADAGVDQRFSVAVAAFGQKLRRADQTTGFGWDRITEIATAARGTDPFGYRAEFLQLVRLAAALDSGRR